MMDKALVKNAASEKQVKKASRLSERAKEDAIEDLRFVLNTAEGRRVMWRLLGFCGLFRSPWAHSGSEQNVNIGKGEVARWLLSEIIDVDEKLWLQMQSENLSKGDVNV